MEVEIIKPRFSTEKWGFIKSPIGVPPLRVWWRGWEKDYLIRSGPRITQLYTILRVVNSRNLTLMGDGLEGGSNNLGLKSSRMTKLSKTRFQEEVQSGDDP